MKKPFVWFAAALVLLGASSVSGRADEFTRIQNSPYTYWVPAPPGYVAQPAPPAYYGYYGAPPPPAYYYGPPPPPAPPVIVVPRPPRFFFGIHFH